MLTGFHGVHVTVGILMLLSLVGMSCADRLPDDPAFPVEMVGLYWHFVDIVWIIIFTVVYLIPTGPTPAQLGAHVADTESRSSRARPRGRWPTHASRGGAPRAPQRQGVRPHRLHPRGAHRPRGRDLLRRRAARLLLIPTLFALAIVKFAIVVLWFMHLKFDDRRYARFFVMGLACAATLYLVVLITFKVFLR